MGCIFVWCRRIQGVREILHQPKIKVCFFSIRANWLRFNKHDNGVCVWCVEDVHNLSFGPQAYHWSFTKDGGVSQFSYKFDQVSDFGLWSCGVHWLKWCKGYVETLNPDTQKGISKKVLWGGDEVYTLNEDNN